MYDDLYTDLGDPIEYDPLEDGIVLSKKRKKSEFLNFRLETGLKHQFSAACKRNGVNGSKLLRNFIKDYLENN